MSHCSSCDPENNCNDPLTCVDCEACISNCLNYIKLGVCSECEDN